MKRLARRAAAAVSRKQAYASTSSVALVIGMFFGAQIVGAFLFGLVVLLVPGYSGLDGNALATRVTNDPWMYLLLMVLIQGVTLLMLRAALRYMNQTWKRIGVGRFQMGYVAYAAAGYGVVLVANTVILAVLQSVLTGVNFDQEQVLSISKTVTGPGLAAVFVALAILPPVVEELLMRGFLFTQLRQRWSFGVSAVIVSTLFGLAHITQARDELFWSGAIGFFVLSLVSCWLREKTKSLWPSIGMHMIQNGLAFYMLFIARIV
ncbi:CPBP family intramembrane metalloprotease [Patescibacteria group bacterium]|nr:MAG: CPBP family intramembrane metalloprotease [Patescibacteria group bacterium]